jgi:hypothetical protein
VCRCTIEIYNAHCNPCVLLSKTQNFFVFILSHFISLTITVNRSSLESQLLLKKNNNVFFLFSSVEDGKDGFLIAFEQTRRQCYKMFFFNTDAAVK